MVAAGAHSRHHLRARPIKHLIGKSVGKAETGSALVNEGGSTMGDLVRQVQRVAVADLINEMGTATRAQEQCSLSRS